MRMVVVIVVRWGVMVEAGEYLPHVPHRFLQATLVPYSMQCVPGQSLVICR